MRPNPRKSAALVHEQYQQYEQYKASSLFMIFALFGSRLACAHFVLRLSLGTKERRYNDEKSE